MALQNIAEKNEKIDVDDLSVYDCRLSDKAEA